MSEFTNNLALVHTGDLSNIDQGYNDRGNMERQEDKDKDKDNHIGSNSAI